MCFGRKDDIQDELPARPVQAPSQPTYATPPKSSMPVSPVSPMSPAHQQQHQQPPHPPIAELANTSQPPVELDAGPPPGPPPSHRQAADDFAPPSGPPPSHRQQAADDFAPPSGPPPSHRQQTDDVAPPPGPPPSHRYDDDVAPPPGPPPSHNHDDVAPPPGPPPAWRQEEDYMAPPPGPPPARRQEEDYIAPPPGPPPTKPQHDWESLVPDTSLFPPPPDLFSGFVKSSASNATEAQSEAGERWCAAHPLCPPLELDPTVLEGRKTGNIRLIAPDGGVFRGKIDWAGPGVWKGKTERKGGDTCLIAFPPVYAVRADSPLIPGKGRTTVYYEVKVGSDNPKEVSLALGYTALPYPGNRMPGWHRGSLAVHGDDGHKYINDRWGGKSFTSPMKRGETYGIGMVFTAQHNGRIEVEVFFTRQGRETGRWNLHEETDAQEDLPVTGLEGYHDLSCAVGTYQETSFEVVFDPARWLFKSVAI